MSGYFGVSRALLDPDHPLGLAQNMEKATRVHAWVDLLGMARWQAAGGMERGQTRQSVRHLAERWRRSREWVEGLLSALEADGAISRVHDRQRITQATLITITNYDAYQGGEDHTQTDAPVKAKPVAKAKKAKKKRVTRSYPDDFLTVWDIHRRGSKSKALDEYRNAVPDLVSQADLVGCLRAYTAAEISDRFLGHDLFRWIRDERWESYIPRQNASNKPRPIEPRR